MGRTWAPVGKTPTVEHNFNWKRLAAMGGITLEGRIYFRVHNGTIRQEQVMDYLVQLLKHIRNQHVVLLWDGSPTHRAKAVLEFLEKNKGRITAFRLPPYCPRFNPVEFLWAHLKWSKMKGFCPKEPGELRKKLNYSVRSLRRRPDIVRSYFRASELPIGEGARQKLLKYCDPEEITKLCIYQ